MTLLAAAGLIFEAPRLAQYGLTRGIYFLVLIPIALGAAGFLFGALKTQAKVSGVSYGWTVELGGPAAIFALVVAGGVFLARFDSTFTLVIRPHGPGGVSDVIKSGAITLDTGDRITHQIGQDGQVVFPNVAIGVQHATIIADVAGYRLDAANSSIDIPASHALYLSLTPLPQMIGATVVDDRLEPLEGVSVALGEGGAVTKTSPGGFFTLPLSPTDSRTRVRVHLSKQGFTSQWIEVSRGDTHGTVKLLAAAPP